MTQNLIIIIVALGSVLILWWLRWDMKRQRAWREAKEQKIARLQRRIADKKKQSKQTAAQEEE